MSNSYQYDGYSDIKHMVLIGVFLFIINFPFFSSCYAQSNALVADLSKSNISINTDFNGASLLLFGSVAGKEGDDIIVVISAPPTEIITRKKSKMSGIWVNSKSIKWKNAPAFYQIFSTDVLSKIATRDVLQSLGIGTQFLNLKFEKSGEFDTTNYNEWVEALNRNMKSASLWKTNENAVQVIRGALFRTEVDLPANITTGDYEVRIIHFRNGRFIAEDKTAIAVKKAGFSSIIYRLAHEYSIFYGIFAIAFAVFAGWLAAAIFRKT